jgi:hypothetical protein
MKLLKAIRVLLEVFGLCALCTGVALWLFPGAWRGLGVGQAIANANAVATSTGSIPNPVTSPADLMALMLSVATIVLTAVAILIGILAFVGLAGVRDHATATAKHQVDLLQADVDLAVARLDERFNELRNTLAAESAEGQGLAVGQGADEMARAISGNSPTGTS